MQNTEQGRDEIEILVEGEGLAEVEAIRILVGSAASEIVAAVAVKGGFPVEGAILFVEDCDEPIDLAIVVLDEEVSGKVHHVHRARKIEVGVFYQGRRIERRFAPSTRVQRVLDWAVSRDGFNIDPAVAQPGSWVIKTERSLRSRSIALVHGSDFRLVMSLGTGCGNVGKSHFSVKTRVL